MGHKKLFKYSKAQIDRAINRRKNGESLQNIAKAEDIEEGALRYHLDNAGVKISKEQHKSNMRKHNPEIEDAVIKLSKEGKTRKFIAQELGVPESYVKTVRNTHKLVIPIEAKKTNVALGRLTRLGYSNWNDRLNDVIYGKKGKLLSNYIDSKSPVNVSCEYGHTWETTPNHLISMDTWCPSCFNTVSKWQREMYDFVVSIVPDAELENCTKIGKELDIFVPSANLGIECDGLYFHSSACSSFRINASRDKAKLAHDAGVNFLMFYEDEWRTKPELVKAMIVWRLRKFTGEYLSARDLTLVKMDRNSDFKSFFERNHIDGHARSSFAWGLLHKGELVCCASFRHNGHREWEVTRFATDYRFAVRGGASRLISQFEGPLISYSNNRLSNGNVYRKLGFVEITQTYAPSYYYTDLKKRVFRTSCQKRHGEGLEELTEENQALNGVFSDVFGHSRPVYRIEDCGHRKWIRR